MAAAPAMSQWIELLGLTETIEGLLDGSIDLDQAREAVEEKKEHYPSISQDYIKILESIDLFIDEIENIMNEQEIAVSEFNEAVHEADGENVEGADDCYFSYSKGRLLTAQEQVELRGLQNDFSYLIDNVADEMDDIADEMDDLNREMEDASEEIEDIQDEQEDLSTEAEEIVETASNELDTAATELAIAEEELAILEDD